MYEDIEFVANYLDIQIDIGWAMWSTDAGRDSSLLAHLIRQVEFTSRWITYGGKR